MLEFASTVLVTASHPLSPSLFRCETNSCCQSITGAFTGVSPSLVITFVLPQPAPVMTKYSHFCIPVSCHKTIKQSRHPRTANPKTDSRLPPLSRPFLLEEQHGGDLRQGAGHLH